MKAKQPKLTLEINGKFIDGDKNRIQRGNITFLVTPPLNEDFWQFRVMVDKEQAIVGFPKFGTIGIGFAKEDSWNTNLPWNSSTEKIWNHIKGNKYFASIPDETCIKAIKIIQKAAKEYFHAENEAEEMLIMQNEPMLMDEKTKKFLSKKEFKQRCNILRARTASVFTRGHDEKKIEIKKYKFCILFGYMDNSYKYKFTLYDYTTEHALVRFMYVLRQHNLHGEADLMQFEHLQVTPVEQTRGFKIPIAF